MFFTLSKTLALLFYPLPLFIFSTLLISIKIKQKRIRAILILSCLSLWLCSCSFVSQRLFLWLEGRHPPISASKLEPVDAIVVLSGMVKLNPSHGLKNRPEFNGNVDRILEGIRLIKLNKAPYILISGGSGDLYRQKRKEAKVLKRWLIEMNVPPEKILIEEYSRNTSENAKNTVRLAREKKWERVLLVTSAFHMTRSVLCFKKEGLDVIPYPVDFNTGKPRINLTSFIPKATALMQTSRFIKELIGITAYKFMGMA